jgi:hypothetical protein
MNRRGKMTEQEFEDAFDAYELDDDYSEFIQLNYDPEERMICNGNDLIDAMESEYLLEEFKNSMVH